MSLASDWKDRRVAAMANVTDPYQDVVDERASTEVARPSMAISADGSACVSDDGGLCIDMIPENPMNQVEIEAMMDWLAEQFNYYPTKARGL